MDNEKRKDRLENMKRKLEILRLELLEQGIDVNNLEPKIGIPKIQKDAEENGWEFENINALYENLPAATNGLSFHDIMTNEMALMSIRWEDPSSDCLIKANEIFVHTFLEDIEDETVE